MAWPRRKNPVSLPNTRCSYRITYIDWSLTQIPKTWHASSNSYSSAGTEMDSLPHCQLKGVWNGLVPGGDNWYCLMTSQESPEKCWREGSAEHQMVKAAGVGDHSWRA